MVLSTPIMRITARPKFVSAKAVRLPKCPFSLANYSLGQVGHGPCEYRDTGHGKAKAPGLRLVRSDEKGCPGLVKLTVSIVGLLELSFISRVLTERLSDDQMHPSRTTHMCRVQEVRRMSPTSPLSIRTITPEPPLPSTTALHMPIKPL